MAWQAELSVRLLLGRFCSREKPVASPGHETRQMPDDGKRVALVQKERRVKSGGPDQDLREVAWRCRTGGGLSETWKQENTGATGP